MDDQVAEVKLHTDVAAIIGERIELKKAGRNYKANCPFHGEKTPSFMVSPELQIFKCFGCAEAGDVFSFLEKYEGMEFPEALKYLADRAGIKLKRTVGRETSEKEKLFEINSQAAKFYHYMLTTHPLGKVALEYLLKNRGLKKETIEEFQLGYAPENSYIISEFLVGKKKFNPKDIELAGIGFAKGQNVLDRLRGRVIFPLFDHRGNAIAFAGRILPGKPEDAPKYINSPETPLYHKSSVLYGLNLTRSLIKKKKVAIVVEGELDAISSYQAGIKNVVAIKGSALTEEQVKLLSRFAEKFILALDSDMAGDAAARRGLLVAGNRGVEVKVAKISKFKDPDEAARGDIESYKSDLIHSEGVWDFLIDSVVKRFDATSGAGKAKISKELTPILSEIEDKIVQAHYANVVAKKLGVPLEAVVEQIGKGDSKSQTISKGAQDPPSPMASEGRGRQSMLEERFLILAFQSDPKILLSSDVEFMFVSPFNKRIIDEYQKYSEIHKTFNATEFGQNLPKELFDGFAKLVLNENPEFVDKPDELKKELDLVQKELKILGVKENLKILAIEIRNLEEKGEQEQLLKAQNKFNKLAKILSGYEDEDGGGIIL